MVIRPWFAPVVVAFWCATTGWLVIAKILPSLAPAPRSGYQAAYGDSSDPIPVAWTVLWNDQPLGWAMSHARPMPDGRLTVESRMRLDRIPLDEVIPDWTRGVVRRVVEAAAGLGPTSAADRSGRPPTEPIRGEPPLPSRISLDARGMLSVDADGDLESFRSTVRFPPAGDTIFLDGEIVQGEVKITVRAQGMRYETSRQLSRSIMLGDELSPQATMPGLEPGKRWTVPIYSPLRLGSSPLEMLHARVAGEESLFWEDHLVRVQVVEYRSEPALHHRPRTRLLVDRSGRVLRQESQFFGARLVFLRRSDEAAEALARNQEAEP